MELKIFEGETVEETNAILTACKSFLLSLAPSRSPELPTGHRFFRKTGSFKQNLSPVQVCNKKKIFVSHKIGWNPSISFQITITS